MEEEAVTMLEVRQAGLLTSHVDVIVNLDKAVARKKEKFGMADLDRRSIGRRLMSTPAMLARNWRRNGIRAISMTLRQ